MDIVAENSKKNLKIKFERKNQLNPQCIHIAKYLESFNSKIVKNKRTCSQLGQRHKIYNV
jgi:hypothetical protein